MFKFPPGSFVVEGAKIIGFTHYDPLERITFYKLTQPDLIKVEILFEKAYEFESDQELTSEVGLSQNFISHLKVQGDKWNVVKTNQLSFFNQLSKRKSKILLKKENLTVLFTYKLKLANSFRCKKTAYAKNCRNLTE